MKDRRFKKDQSANRRGSLERGARRINATARSQMQDAGIVWYAVVAVMRKLIEIANALVKADRLWAQKNA
jgi:hypothetical protein